MWEPFRKIADNEDFQTFILWVILLNAVVLGLETSAALIDLYGDWFGIIYLVTQIIFIAEIAIRLLAHGPGILPFFRDGWNCFDFTVVAVSLVPAAGPFATVARVFRLLRIMRLVSVSDNLRATVSGIGRSLSSLFYVSLVFGLVMYVFAILGFYLFGDSTLTQWSSLGSSLLVLLQILTLDGWSSLQRDVMSLYPWAWLYFFSFLLCVTVILFSLIVAAVRSAVDSGDSNALPSGSGGGESADVLRELRDELLRLRVEVERLGSVNKDVQS